MNDQEFREETISRLATLEAKVDNLRWGITITASIVGAVVATVIGVIIK